MRVEFFSNCYSWGVKNFLTTPLPGPKSITIYSLPGHAGIYGNEQAGRLANTESTHEFSGPEPALPVSTSVIQKGIKEWVNEFKEFYFRKFNYAGHTKSFIKELNVNFVAPLICFERR